MIRALNHVGVSVVNLERSIAFYRDLLGMAVIREREFSGEQYEGILGLAGVKGKLAILQAATMRIELFEFSHPVPRLSDPKRLVCDHGITHFCIEVSDVDHEYGRLKAAGVTFHCAPVEFPGKVRATYGRDPDGNVFEMIQIS